MRRTSSSCAALLNVLPSSTNPRATFTVNTLDEHLDMLMVPSSDPRTPRIVADQPWSGAKQSRLRIVAAMGAISMMSSDSQAVGQAVTGDRIRTLTRGMKAQFGSLGDRPENEATSPAFTPLPAIIINPSHRPSLGEEHRRGVKAADMCRRPCLLRR